MTEDFMALLQLAANHGHEKFLEEPGQYALQRLMELQAESHCRADR